MAKKHTAAETNAYYSGMGYAVAHSSRGIQFRKETVRNSFQEGYRRGRAMMRKAPGKYPPLGKKK